jgi:hypothetical protein
MVPLSRRNDLFLIKNVMQGEGLGVRALQVSQHSWKSQYFKLYIHGEIYEFF